MEVAHPVVMTLLAFFQPPKDVLWSLRSLPAGSDLITPLLAWLAGRDADLPEQLEDWQLRDLNLTRAFPGPNHPTHVDLP